MKNQQVTKLILYSIYGLNAMLTVVTVLFGKVTVDVQLYTTYFVVYLSYLTVPAIIILLLQGVFYARMIRLNKVPNIYFSTFYFIGTVISIIGIVTGVFPNFGAASGRQYYTWTAVEPEADMFIRFVVLYCLSQFGYLSSILLAKKTIQPNT